MAWQEKALSWEDKGIGHGTNLESIPLGWASIIRSGSKSENKTSFGLTIPNVWHIEDEMSSFKVFRLIQS